MQMTLTLTEDAARFLRSKVRKKTGHGAYLSTLLVAEKTREEMRAQAQHTPAMVTADDWRQSGCNVD
jgi:hypothetical protein